MVGDEAASLPRLTTLAECLVAVATSTACQETGMQDRMLVALQLMVSRVSPCGRRALCRTSSELMWAGLQTVLRTLSVANVDGLLGTSGFSDLRHSLDRRTIHAVQNAYLAILTLSLIHISEPTRLLSISYAVFCLKKKKINH
eukprot:TRINITY_DN63541_c0_g1_i1.p1 TRINITY_DN63541_c0_g1~~TRINITY_DN63541_c0_g1_i1.p1  ORF type:complete len:143 (-),score=26.77 TRINITY_DN63541_c0_g1_i1:101-529(-)